MGAGEIKNPLNFFKGLQAMVAFKRTVDRYVYQPSRYANINGATMVASLSIIYFGV